MSSYYKRYVRHHVGNHLDDKSATRITNAVINRSLAIVVVPLLATLLMVFAIVFADPLFHYVEDTLGISAILIHSCIAVPLLLGAAFVLLGITRQQKVARETLHRHLLTARIRPEICLYCNYSLFNSTSATCPECGAEIASVDSRQDDAQS